MSDLDDEFEMRLTYSARRLKAEIDLARKRTIAEFTSDEAVERAAQKLIRSGVPKLARAREVARIALRAAIEMEQSAPETATSGEVTKLRRTE